MYYTLPNAHQPMLNSLPAGVGRVPLTDWRGHGPIGFATAVYILDQHANEARNRGMQGDLHHFEACLSQQVCHQLSYYKSTVLLYLLNVGFAAGLRPLSDYY